MFTNDIKKGMRVQLNNGWYGTMYDNRKGNTRMVEVEGIYTEIGSVYSHDLHSVLIDGTWQAIELTPAQIKLEKTIWG